MDGEELIMKILHIFGQEAFHDDVYIVGNKSELIKLSNIILQAIWEEFGSDEFCVNDGEGYSISVRRIEESINDKIAVPYSKDYAKEKRPKAIYPWQEINKP